MLLFAAAWAAPLNVNTARANQLDSVPGLGPSKARSIVEYRERHGPFQALDDLLLVPGLGPATVAVVRRFVVAQGPVHSVETENPKAQEARHPSHLRFSPNTAEVATLAALPGVTGSRAEAIVAERVANGPFANCAALARVPDLGPATVSVLGRYCIEPSAR